MLRGLVLNQEAIERSENFQRDSQDKLSFVNLTKVNFMMMKNPQKNGQNMLSKRQKSFN